MRHLTGLVLNVSVRSPGAISLDFSITRAAIPALQPDIDILRVTARLSCLALQKSTVVDANNSVDFAHRGPNRFTRMSNPISAAMRIGTLGELLVQVRLLQFDVQAASPLKDSGNDLIAVRGTCFHTIQVKTTSGLEIPAWPQAERIYSLLAIVCLAGEDRHLYLDASSVYLLPRTALANLRRSWDALRPYEITGEVIDRLFAPG